MVVCLERRAVLKDNVSYFANWSIFIFSIDLLEQDTRFELALSAWKADVLAANTNPAYLIPVFEMETGKKPYCPYQHYGL